jgi:peptide-methionine (S)-S-oxide reductase
MPNPSTEIAIFGGGCFWCTEAVFQNLRGVKKVTSGYAGGQTQDPTYEDVSNGDTGHAEVIQIEFDPQVIPYATLLEVFWHTHDPTTRNQQGADVGTQYRSIILTTTDEQAQIAEESKTAQAASGEFHGPIVTEIQPLSTFYPAESYHQRFYENNADKPYCQVVISPKLTKVMKEYGQLMKNPAL